MRIFLYYVNHILVKTHLCFKISDTNRHATEKKVVATRVTKKKKSVAKSDLQPKCLIATALVTYRMHKS
jgi:hypothetical protein